MRGSGVYSGCAVADIYSVELCFMAYFFFVSASDALDEGIYSVIFHDADRASAESAACDTGAITPGIFHARSTRISISSQDTS